MSDSTNVYVAAYESPGAARAAFRNLKRLRSEGQIESAFDAALVFKDEHGSVHLRKREKPTVRGAWTGAGIGALLGVVLPMALPVTVALNSTKGGVVSYLKRGIPRAEAKELGRALEAGEAALVILSTEPIDDVLETTLVGAAGRVERRLAVASTEFEAALVASEEVATA